MMSIGDDRDLGAVTTMVHIPSVVLKNSLEEDWLTGQAEEPTEERERVSMIIILYGVLSVQQALLKALWIYN